MHNYWLAEVLLALAAALVASQYWYIARERCRSAALLIVAALACLALTATVGAYRYGLEPGVTQWHRTLSTLSGYLTFSLIGLALLWARVRPRWGSASWIPAAVTVALVVVSARMAAETPFSASVAALYSGVGLALWLLVASGEIICAAALPRFPALLLAAGAVLVATAGLVIGTDATRLFGLSRMNWFHLFLAFGVLALLAARPLFALEKEDNE